MMTLYQGKHFGYQWTVTYRGTTDGRSLALVGLNWTTPPWCRSLDIGWGLGKLQIGRGKL